MHEDRGLSIAAADNRKSAAKCGSISEKFKAAFNEYRSQWTPVDDYEFTSPVEAFAQNQFGIRDLVGNVWEWCMDSNGPVHKVLRGSSYLHGPLTDCRHQDILSGYPMDMDMCLPVPPSELCRSTFRLSCRDDCRNEQRLHSGLPLINDVLIDKAGWKVYPDSGFRVVIAQ